MKKVAAVFFVLLYSTFSVGATMHLHYCMGKFVSSSLFNTNNDACSKCGMESHEGESSCCKDVKVSVKISDKHFTSSTACFDSSCTKVVQPSGFGAVIGMLPVTGPIPCRQGYSPPDVSIPLFIQARSLRI